MNASSSALPPPPGPPPPDSNVASAHQPPPPVVPAGMVTGHQVSKFFGDVVAVTDVSFGIDAGVTALLGPNGAGKSTLFRMLCGLTPTSRGSVAVLGRNPRTDRDVRGRIGLVPQQDALFDRMSALEFVELAAATHGLSNASALAVQALKEVDLDANVTKPVGSYSKGMRQRVKVAAALINDPEVLILDEPLTGLDPVQRRRLIALFHRLGGSGRCVLVSSHVLEEVARIGSRVLVIAQGRLVASGDYRDLRELMDDRPHRIKVGCSDPRRLAAGLIEAGLTVGLRIEPDALVLDTVDADAFGRQVAHVARRLDVRITALAPLDDDLESVFRYLVEGR